MYVLSQSRQYQPRLHLCPQWMQHTLLVRHHVDAHEHDRSGDHDRARECGRGHEHDDAHGDQSLRSAHPKVHLPIQQLLQSVQSDQQFRRDLDGGGGVRRRGGHGDGRASR
jgi:hypothetical protein